MASGPVPVFVTISVSCVVEPIGWLPKASGLCPNETAGAAAVYQKSPCTDELVDTPVVCGVLLK